MSFYSKVEKGGAPSKQELHIISKIPSLTPFSHYRRLSFYCFGLEIGNVTPTRSMFFLLFLFVLPFCLRIRHPNFLQSQRDPLLVHNHSMACFNRWYLMFSLPFFDALMCALGRNDGGNCSARGSTSSASDEGKPNSKVSLLTSPSSQKSV